MIGVVANSLGVLLGGVIGLLLNKAIPERITDCLMKGVGLCTIYIGITGSLEGKTVIVVILSMVIGIVTGELLRLDDGLNKFAEKMQGKLKNKSSDLAEGFVSSTLLFCVGAMTIVGPLRAGLAGDNQMLFTKSVIDCIAAATLASTLGVGVMFSAISVFMLEGAITLLAHVISPVMTEAIIAEMTCVGSIIIIGLGMNIIGVTKFKVMNFVPAIFLPILLCQIFK